MKMGSSGPSETSVPIYQTTRCHIRLDSIHIYGHESLSFTKKRITFSNAKCPPTSAKNSTVIFQHEQVHSNSCIRSLSPGCIFILPSRLHIGFPWDFTTKISYVILVSLNAVNSANCKEGSVLYWAAVERLRALCSVAFTPDVLARYAHLLPPELGLGLGQLPSLQNTALQKHSSSS
jgi:hypothetical protein